MEQTLTQENVLDEIRYEWQSEDATKGQRLANYLIDMLAFYAFIFIGAMAAALFIPGGAAFIDSLESTPDLVDRLITLILYGLFTAAVEGLFNGRSLGKIITRTKAIRYDGGNLTWADAFVRGCTRMVPFEVLSGLGKGPWHDRWTNTRVVQHRRE